ncbi:MAG TPA: hypothetical protein VG102_01980 [Candidatus Paceibacterota bacterium]|jgi:hypothetical protein|nr:hypothetical protein [Candidatus Paceibacterota bacterium]
MAESLEKGKSKHGSWVEKMKSTLRVAGLGTLAANYLLFMTACAMFPPGLLVTATMAAAYGLSDSKGGGNH